MTREARMTNGSQFDSNGEAGWLGIDGAARYLRMSVPVNPRALARGTGHPGGPPLGGGPEGFLACFGRAQRLLDRSAHHPSVDLPRRVDSEVPQTPPDRQSSHAFETVTVGSGGGESVVGARNRCATRPRSSHGAVATRRQRGLRGADLQGREQFEDSTGVPGSGGVFVGQEFLG